MTTKAEFRKQVMEQGVPAAFDGLMRVLQDPRASATALASASRTMLEAASLLQVPETEGEKEPPEMSDQELQANIARLRAEALERARPMIDVAPRQIEGQKASDGVFD